MSSICQPVQMLVINCCTTQNFSLIPPSIQSVVQTQKCTSLVGFEKHFYFVQHFTFLPKYAEQLLLHLRPRGITIIKETTEKPCEKT